MDQRPCILLPFPASCYTGRNENDGRLLRSTCMNNRRVESPLSPSLHPSFRLDSQAVMNSNTRHDIKSRAALGPTSSLRLLWAGRYYTCISSILSAGKALLLRTDCVNEAHFSPPLFNLSSMAAAVAITLGGLSLR